MAHHRDDNDNSKVWSVQTGKYYDFLKDEKNIRYASFSEDSQWLITKDDNDNAKVWSVETGKYPDFLKDEKIFATLLFLGMVNGSSLQMIKIIPKSGH
jgi:WD40 repeat protein